MLSAAQDKVNFMVRGMGMSLGLFSRASFKSYTYIKIYDVSE
jgi:hypothetical protein